MLFIAGLATGLGTGVLAGIAVGIWFLKETSGAMITAVEKSTFAVAYPHSPEPPQRVDSPVTEHAFDPQEVDDERIPDWMDEDYPMAGNPSGTP